MKNEKSKTETEACANCRFFKPASLTDGFCVAPGRLRVFLDLPSSSVPDPTNSGALMTVPARFVSAFPHVGADIWCGDYKIWTNHQKETRYLPFIPPMGTIDGPDQGPQQSGDAA